MYICDGSEINIYDGHSVKITVSEEAVLKVRRFPNTKLWHIPLQSEVTNVTTKTIILNGPTCLQSRNPRYVVPSNAAMLEKINIFTQKTAHPLQTNVINNV